MKDIKINLNGPELSKLNGVMISNKLEYVPVFSINNFSDYYQYINWTKKSSYWKSFILSRIYNNCSDDIINRKINDMLNKGLSKIDENILISVFKQLNKIVYPVNKWEDLFDIIKSNIFENSKKSLNSIYNTSSFSYTIKDLFNCCSNNCVFSNNKFNCKVSDLRYIFSYFSLIRVDDNLQLFPEFYLGVHKDALDIIYYCHILDKPVPKEIFKFFVRYDFLNDKSSVFKENYNNFILKNLEEQGIEIVNVKNLDYMLSYVEEPIYESPKDKDKWLSDIFKDFLNEERSKLGNKSVHLEVSQELIKPEKKLIVVSPDNGKIYELV